MRPRTEADWRATRARQPDSAGVVERAGTRISWEAFGHRSDHDPAAADLERAPCRPRALPDRRPRTGSPGGHVRPAGQRSFRPTGGSRCVCGHGVRRRCARGARRERHRPGGRRGLLGRDVLAARARRRPSRRSGHRVDHRGPQRHRARHPERPAAPIGRRAARDARRQPVARVARSGGGTSRVLFVPAPDPATIVRDSAIADELSALRPGVEVEWLVSRAVRPLLEEGAAIHPASRHLHRRGPGPPRGSGIRRVAPSGRSSVRRLHGVRGPGRRGSSGPRRGGRRLARRPLPARGPGAQALRLRLAHDIGGLGQPGRPPPARGAPARGCRISDGRSGRTPADGAGSRRSSWAEWAWFRPDRSARTCPMGAHGPMNTSRRSDLTHWGDTSGMSERSQPSWPSWPEGGARGSRRP